MYHLVPGVVPDLTPGLASFLAADLIQDLVVARSGSLPCLSPDLESSVVRTLARIEKGLVPELLPYLA